MSNFEGDVGQSLLNAAVEAEEYNLVRLLRPTITIDGNKYCVLYGPNLEEGVAGFGDTPYQAVLDFNRAWVRRAPKAGE